LPAVWYKIKMMFAGMKTKPLLLFSERREDFPAGKGHFTTPSEALAKLPGVWYKIEMMFAGMKTETLLLFAGRRQEGGFSPPLPAGAHAPAGKLLLCENLLYAGNFMPNFRKNFPTIK